MAPKENCKKFKGSQMKKRMIMPHKLKQATKNLHASATKSPFSDDATTPWQQDAYQLNEGERDVEQLDAVQSDTGHLDAGQLDPRVSLDAIPSSSPTIDPSPSAQGSRQTPNPNNQSSSVHAHSSDDRAQLSRHTNHDLNKAPDGRPYIFPDGKGWNPCRVASRALTSVIQSQFRNAWSRWGEIPPKRVDRMFLKLGKKVAWRPEDEFELKIIFKSKGSKRLSEMLMEARNKNERPSWIGPRFWKGLEKKWQSTDYKVKSARNKNNRASAKGGSVHTSGSISTNEYVIRMRQEMGREPTVDEVFLWTRTRKEDRSSWVDERSKRTYETYKEKMKKASDNGTKEVDPATQLNLWAESAGGKTRGRLYGTGDMAKRYKPGVSSLTQQSHVSPYSSQVSAGIAAQMAAIEERANAAEGDARVAREECLKANKRTKDLERQLKELAESVATIKGRRQRHHPDYDDDSDTDADSVDSVED